MPPKPKAGGDSLIGILAFGTLYAVAATGIASLFEESPDKKNAKEEPKQDAKEEPKPKEKTWLERNTRVKEKGYYIKQVQEEFKDQKITNNSPIIEQKPLQLTEQDRLQAERMLRSSDS